MSDEATFFEITVAIAVVVFLIGVVLLGLGLLVRWIIDSIRRLVMTVVGFINGQNVKDEIQCSVCLSELADGGKTRVLPTCNHSFHDDCIERWFKFHSMCPICRKIVSFERAGFSS
ncbi:unnamed protein product [Microthlaspi erraticum]|uniref:RING-type domain-containing protein n=1 Tax=Microthlaspi erraticum TaxID=1685480 RepID=A0A6D2KIL6_9BRAS|nr:unnamed protein product [Microthlaspi erraticum]